MKLNINIYIFCTLVFGLTSCFPFKTLHSTTYIKANDAFILGNNEHQKFSAQLTNTSSNDLVIWQCPISGGQHSPITLKPNEYTKVVVAKNTAIRIMNQSSTEASVKLKVKGDTGLSMEYNN